jgi:Zn-dependent membrane protease YugP
VLYFDPLYFVIVGPAMLLAFWAQLRVKGAYKKWSKVQSQSGMTGAEAAQRMLEGGGVRDCTIEPGKGYLTDHYDPRSKTLRLSEDVYHGKTVAALGIACHEAGHAFQHAEGYTMLTVRSKIVPLANVGSWIAFPMIILGIWLQMMHLAVLGVAAFGCLVLFQLVTLPVEFDASRRAKIELQRLAILRNENEVLGVDKVLNAAAMTYVAATVTAVAQLLYFVYRAGLFGRR